MKILIATITGGALMLATAVGVGAEPFLCPIVGAGTSNAPGLQGTAATSSINPPAGASLLPGSNQAGDHANANAYNANGGPSAGNVPGTPGYTPIWNP